MKRLLNMLLLLAMAMAASAQISWNVSGGVGLAFPSFEQKSSAGIAAKISVGCEIPLSSDISFIPTVGLEKMEAKYIGLERGDSYYDYTTSSWHEEKDYYAVEELSISRPVVSLLFGYRMPIGTDCSLMAKLGPYVGYTLEDFLGDGMTVDTGVDIGIDFEYRHFIVGASLEYGFMKVNTGVLYDYGDYIYEQKFTNRAAFFNIGYKF